MWIFLALTAAFGAAGTSFALKRAVAHGGVLVSTVACRAVAAVLLAGIVAALGGWPHLPAEYWRALGLVLVPEVLGTLFMTLALRSGDLSLVQPLMGLLPPLVTIGGAVFLRETPTPVAAGGVLLVTLGVYCVGLQPGTSALEPLRGVARSRAGAFAAASAVSWSLATLVHKRGIAAVGPFPWAVTLALGSALALGAVLPLVAWRSGDGVGVPERAGPWGGAVALAGLAFALQQAGLHLAFRATQAGYVMAVSSVGVLIGTLLGIVVLRERAAGALLVSGGAALIALFG
ncbi:MAG TPA: EamA family transporter [Longimicrobium sp.]|nr:EamA family transporter [Longimicrobium sp.]